MTIISSNPPAVRFGEAYRIISRNQQGNDGDYLTRALGNMFHEQGIDAIDLYPAIRQTLNGQTAWVGYLLTGDELLDYRKTLIGKAEYLYDRYLETDSKLKKTAIFFKSVPIFLKTVFQRISGQLEKQERQHDAFIQNELLFDPIDIEAKQTAAQASFTPSRWTDELTRVLKTD